MVGFHNKNNFKEQGKIYGESEECQLDKINSDDICAGNVHVQLFLYTCTHICMYVHNEINGEKGKLLIA